MAFPATHRQGRNSQGPPASPPSLHRSPVVARSVQLAPEGVRSPNGPLKDPRGTISFSGGHSFTAPYFEATTTGAQSSAGRSDFTSPERPIVFCGQMSPPRASSPQELSPPVPMQLPIGPLQQAAALQPFPAQLQGMQFKSQVLAPQVQGRRYVPQAPTRSAVSLHVEDIGQPKMARSPQARSPLRQPPHTEGPLERTWEEAVQTLRQEVREQCRIQADVLRSEVAAMCTESRQQFQESLLKLQDTRGSESSQVRMMLQSLDAQVQDCRQAVADVSRGQERPMSSRTGLGLADLEVFKMELEAERICRSERIGELYDRINREVSGVLKILEDHRIAAVEALVLERDARCKELEEVRATIDSVWKKATGSVQSDTAKRGYYFTYIDAPNADVKEFVGDPDDVNTLYDMVREALGDTVHLRQLVSEERDQRSREQSQSRQQIDAMAREINTIQALLREATAGGKGSSRVMAHSDRVLR